MTRKRWIALLSVVALSATLVKGYLEGDVNPALLLRLLEAAEMLVGEAPESVTPVEIAVDEMVIHAGE